MTIRARAAENRSTRKRYARLKEAGLCPRCGSTRDGERWSQCGECRRINRESKAKSERRIVPALKRLKLCISCRTSKAIEGQTRCGYCAERQDEAHAKLRNARIKAGECPRCGGKPEAGRTNCPNCNARERRYYYAKRKAKKAGMAKTKAA